MSKDERQRLLPPPSAYGVCRWGTRFVAVVGRYSYFITALPPKTEVADSTSDYHRRRD